MAAPRHIFSAGGFMSSTRFEGFTKIDSGHIDGVKYDSLSRVLAVRFQNGYVYHVQGVSPEDHQAFMDAPSQGEHYHQHIKPNYHIHRVR
jgi:hypothetical protein